MLLNIRMQLQQSKLIIVKLVSDVVNVKVLCTYQMNVKLWGEVRQKVKVRDFQK